MKPQVIQLKFRTEDKELFRAIEKLRKERGMSRKGFIMLGLGKAYPELKDDVTKYLLNTGYKNA